MIEDDLKELHKQIVQTIIDFYKTHELPGEAWALDFNIDDLETSVKFGKWHASSDSWCSLEDTIGNPIVTSI